MNKTFLYKIFIPISYTSDTGEQIPAGLYDVISDNEDYDTTPSVAIVKFNTIDYSIPFLIHHMFEVVWNPQKDEAYAVLDTFNPDIVNEQLSEDEMFSTLDSLRPYYMSVDGFINGDKDYEWDGFDNLKEAYLSALMNEWSYHPISKKRMDENFLKVMSKI